MKKQNKVAVARWVSGGKEHLVVLRPYENGLILHTTYYAGEVVDIMEALRQSLERGRGAAASPHGPLRRAPKPAPALAAGRKTRTPAAPRKRKAS